tara:strand:+ start:2267 stop:2689 length:423 start_codon:yes stop_codon:yes gene_type:complete
MIVKIKKLHPDAVVPTYAKVGDAAVDLVAVDKHIDKHHNVVFDTGLAFEIPYGFVGLLFPRSSVSKTNLSLANSVGVIDSGYRGPVMLKYRRQGTTNCKWDIGDRVGQLMIIPYPEVEFIETDKLSITDRGSGGFGSTGQ